MKKGLAVVLAAATVLTFAPTSVFAGTFKDTTTNLKSTMNETANVWSYDDSTFTGAALSDEQNAVVVLTPSNPTGSVTFTKAVTDKDTLNNGKWFTYSGGSWTTTASEKEQYGTLELTAAKNGKTLNLKASMSALRALTKPEYYTVNDNLSEANLATNLSVKVVLAPHAVKMNNLKVVLKKTTDFALDRYKNHGSDVYDSFEARPDNTNPVDTFANGGDDIKTVQKDIAPDGKRFADEDTKPDRTINLAVSKDLPFKEISTNADLEFKSNDESVATVDKDGIHGKAVGETDVTISTKQSLTAYGEVTVTIHVIVVNTPKAKLTTPADLTVKGYGVKNATAIGASGTNIQKNSIKYDFVYWDAVAQKFRSFRTAEDTLVYRNNGVTLKINPFRLSDSQDSVYVEQYPGYDTKDYNWNAYLEVTATGAAGYDNPDPVYTRLHFDDNAPFDLDSTSQKLHIGESVQITTKSVSAVTGGAFTYKSYNPAVATVSDKGVIKAVGEGSTTVDVTYGGYTKSVNVTVKAYENGQGSTAAPEKVTGVKVSNKKGAKVSVKWDSQDSSVNFRVYKKVGSGKWIAKNVTSNKATLSVKKGAKVTVKVKAFTKGTNGKTTWGPKATSKSLKTDRK